jgi:hypothetical protein
MFIVFKPYLKHSYGLMNILKNENREISQNLQKSGIFER